MQIDGASFDGIVAGGDAAEGKEVWFRIRVNGFDEETLIGDAGKIDEAIAALVMFADQAAAARAKSGPVGNIQQDRVHPVKAARIGKSFDAKSIVLRVELVMGASFNLALSPELADQIAQELTEKTRVPEPPPTTLS